MSVPVLILGNILSFIAAIFTSLSCLSKSHRSVFFFQTLECLTLAVAQVVFSHASSAIMLLIGAMRNAVISRGKYKPVTVCAFFIATLFLGVAFNESGIIGFIPILTTLIYTVSCYAAKTFMALRISILTNLVLWLIYSAFILDFGTVASSVFAIIFCLYTVYKRLYG